MHLNCVQAYMTYVHSYRPIRYRSSEFLQFGEGECVQTVDMGLQIKLKRKEGLTL
jgi:hypothetical protein